MTECLVCLDSPPNEAVIVVDEIPMCRECFDCVAPNLGTDAIKNLSLVEEDK